jgi:hypothetical protein
MARIAIIGPGAVARFPRLTASGAPVAGPCDDLPEWIVARHHRAAPDAINPLHAGRLEARQGVIVRLGRKHGIPTPANNRPWRALAQ